MTKHRLAVVLAWLTGVGLAVVTAPPAFANTTVTGRAVGAYFNVSHNGGTLNFWAGAYQTDQGLAFCLQPTKASSVGQPVGDPVEMTSFSNDQGVVLTTAQINQLAYLTWKVSLNTNPSTSDAIMYKLVSTTLLGYTAVPIVGTTEPHDLSLDDPGSDAINIASTAGVLDAALALLATARTKANNWDGTGALTLTAIPSKPGGALTATVRLPGLGSGFPVVFTITKPDGKTETIKVTTSDDVANLSYTPSSFGHYQVRAELGEPVAPRYPLIADALGQSQSMLMITAKPKSWASDTGFDLLRPPPVIATSVSTQYALPGETISDTVNLAKLVVDDATSYQVTGGLFILPAFPDNTCPAAGYLPWNTAEAVLQIEATPVPPDSIGKDGTAEMTVGTWQVPMDAAAVCLSYGETLTMSVKGSPDITVEHPVGDITQTALVVRPPTVATQISLTALSAGDTVSDTITISGLSPVEGVTYTVAGKLIGLPATADMSCPGTGAEAWHDAEILATFDGEVVRDGTTSDQLEMTGQGSWQVAARANAMCVTYTETVTMTAPGHDPVVVEHAPGQPTQSALYQPFQAITGGVGTIDLGGKLAYALCGLGGVAAGTWMVRRFIWQA